MTVMDMTRLRVVVVGEGVNTPIRGTLTTKCPLCQCLPVFTRSDTVGTFDFGDNTMSSLATTIDMQRLMNLAKKRSASMIRLKLKIRLGYGKMEAQCDLKTFLSDLSQQGYADLWWQGQIVLRVVKDHQEEKDDTTILDHQEHESNNTEGQSLTTEAQQTQRRKRNRHHRRRKAASTKEKASDDKAAIVKDEEKALHNEKEDKLVVVTKKKDGKVKATTVKKENKADTVKKADKAKTVKGRKKSQKKKTVVFQSRPVEEGVTFADIVKKTPPLKKPVQKSTAQPKERVSSQPVTWVTLNVPAECRRCTLNILEQHQLLQRYRAVRVSVPPENAHSQCPVVIRGPLGDVRAVRGELVSRLGIQDRKRKQLKRRTGRPQPQKVTLGSYVQEAVRKGSVEKQTLKKTRRSSERRGHSGKDCG